MCYSSGSIDQAVNPCPMCKVYPHAKCPHIRETCRNRTHHPRMDVLYLKNAEVESFNGCGYCKWANTNPPPKSAGYNNLGWPGCCRPPHPSEYHLVQIADWRAVSIVHRVPIPKEIETVLNSLSLPPLPCKASNGQPTSPASRTMSSKPTTPSTRKNNGTITPSSKSNILSTKPMNMPTQGRGRSPHGSITPGTNLSRSSSSTAVSSSVSNSPSMENPVRRKTAPTTSDKLIEGTQSAHSSPSRKSIDLENPVTPRRVSSVRRPALTPATTSVSLSKVVVDSRSVQDRTGTPPRRRSISGTTPFIGPRTADNFIVLRTSKKDDDCSASSSSGSSDGIGSLSDSTVTSDGGFTDYLSDESEAELQRQAEARAAVVAQNQAEEQEFKMARQQLANVGLRPPKSWNPNNTPPTTPSKSPSSPGVTLELPPSRSANVPSPSFAIAATAIMQTGQARG